MIDLAGMFEAACASVTAITLGSLWLVGSFIPKPSKPLQPCKHRYEQRFDEIPNGKTWSQLRVENSNQMRAMLYRRVYIKDVCIRCGAVVDRAPS